MRHKVEATQLNKPVKGHFERFAGLATKVTGSTQAFLAACFIIAAWIITGPIFDYSDTWQLVINTGTTVITFLMVFLIQKTQNKESVATQIKLNELIAAHERTSNNIINVEDLSEEELETLHKYYTLLARRAKKDKSIYQSHSVEEISTHHKTK